MNAPSLDGTAKTEGIEKLDILAENIRRQRAVYDKTEQIETEKENELLASTPPPETFRASPEILEIGATVVFALMRWATNLCNKDLLPMTPEQKDRMAYLLDKLAQKYVPADFMMHQEMMEFVMIPGGIVITNLTDIQPKGIPAAAQRAPESSPNLPEAKVTVIHAEPPKAQVAV